MSAALIGTWEMIRAEQNGEESPEFVALRVELELTADTYIVRLAGQIADRGTYTVTRPERAGGETVESIEQNSGSLTLTGTEGSNAGRMIPCIFQLAGDRLRVCYGLGGSPPTAFATATGKQLYLASYRRRIDLARSASHDTSVPNCAD